MSFTVAIVGRPNVGKSTLFNRLIGKKQALVDPTPGVTRDRIGGEARIGGLVFDVIDTAGLADGKDGELEGRLLAQTETAVAEADLAMMLIDAKTGLTALDRQFADWLRRQTKPVLLVANKCGGTGCGELRERSLGTWSRHAGPDLGAEWRRHGRSRGNAGRRHGERARSCRSGQPGSDYRCRHRPIDPSSSPWSAVPMSANRR